MSQPKAREFVPFFLLALGLGLLSYLFLDTSGEVNAYLLGIGIGTGGWGVFFLISRFRLAKEGKELERKYAVIRTKMSKDIENLKGKSELVGLERAVAGIDQCLRTGKPVIVEIAGEKVVVSPPPGTVGDSEIN